MVTSGNAISRLIVGPLFGFLAGWLVDRFGPRRLMLAGILMAGGALIGLANMSAAWMFYVFYVFNALGYVCGGPLPNQVLLSRRFDRTRGRAMGIAYLGIGVGGALVPILSNWLTASIGWRGSLATLGVLIVALSLPLAWFVDDGEEGSARGHASPGREASHGDASAIERAGGGAPAPVDKDGRERYDGHVPLGTVLRSPAFYLIALGSMCSIAAVGGTNQHLKLFLSLDRQFSQTDASQIISLVLALSIAGRLMMGWLADRLPRKYVMVFIYLLIAVAIPVLLRGGSPSSMYLFAVIFGLGLGGEYMIIPLVAGDLFGVKVLGRVMGIVLTADGVAEATAPMLVGYLRDITGSYDAGFSVLIGAAILGALAIGLLPARRELDMPAAVTRESPNLKTRPT
jgi:sugar phosphate permease